MDEATWEVRAEPEPATPYGVVIDGALYPLDGQPPPAKGGAWWPPRASEPPE